jgi:hypothetical protein
MLRELLKAEVVTLPDYDFPAKFYYELYPRLFLELGTLVEGFLLFAVG